MSNPAVQHLIAGQAADGGWGAYPGSVSRTEATALASLALGSDRAAADEAPLAAAREWLRSRQLPSGAWPLGDDVAEPNWATSLAALATAHFAPDSAQIASATRWLTDQEGEGRPWWIRILSPFVRNRPVVDLDPDLIGWPWVADTFSWVEPTAYAVMALRRIGRAAGGDRATERVEEARRLLIDRVCDGGGWNYGNSRVLGETLPPYPDTTALGLLALGDRSDLPAVTGGLDALDRLLAHNDSLLSLGLATLAFRVHGRDAGPLRERLRVKLERWDGGETRALAWGALALSESDDPLGVGRA